MTIPAGMTIAAFFELIGEERARHFAELIGGRVHAIFHETFGPADRAFVD